MNAARLAYIGGGLAPLNKIVSSKLADDHSSIDVTLNCGHVSPHATHFFYSPGELIRCYQCGKERAFLLPEFSKNTEVIA